ncbi:lysylphosphatidylglycerol synthase transmembrane domain-containing protein [Oryzobacter telluris]|uniref:lysylphosphatidylglycerol synthase transmembrane domain-containing protein n=1 Tax=Oryzobacter telluris TaxID=3149179 RepID=UPI00370D7583
MSRGRKQVLQAAVGLGLAAILLVWGLPYFAKTEWSEIWTHVRAVPLSHVLGFQVLMLAGLWCYTFTFTGALRGLTHSKALIINLCGSSVSNLLPGGGAVGLAATYAMCRSWGFTRRATSTSAIVTGVWNVLARIALPVVAILALWLGGVTLPVVLTELAVGGALTGLALLGAFVAIMVSERAAQAIGRGVDHLLGPLLRRRSRASGKPAMRIEELVHDLRARINDVVSTGWLAMTLGMVGFFGAYYVLFVLVMRQTGVTTMPLNLLFAAFAIGRLLTAVGITPGGVGVTETVTATVLVGWGADSAAATAGVVLFSIITHVMEVPLGGLGWLLWTLSPKVTAPPEGQEPTFERTARGVRTPRPPHTT